MPNRSGLSVGYFLNVAVAVCFIVMGSAQDTTKGQMFFLFAALATLVRAEGGRTRTMLGGF